MFGFGFVNGGDEHSADGSAVVLEGFVLLVRDIASAIEQLQPILSAIKTNSFAISIS